MAAERYSVPCHLALTQPIDETAITGYPAVEGAYDAAAQIWRLPDGMPLTDPKAIQANLVLSQTFSVVHGIISTDDAHIDS